MKNTMISYQILTIDCLEKVFIEESKAMFHGRRCNDEYFDKNYRLQLKTEEIEYCLSYVSFHPETLNCGKSPVVFKLNESSNAFEEKLQVEADRKTMKTLSTTQSVIIFTPN